MIFLATDATFANPGRTYNFDQTLEKLASENVVVFGLASGSTNSDLNRVTSETGGEVYLLSSDSSGIVEKIQESVDKINNNLKSGWIQVLAVNTLIQYLHLQSQ